MFKKQYRIVQRWKTSTNRVSGETVSTGQGYFIQERTFWSILFGETWRDITTVRFDTCEDAKRYLIRLVNEEALIVKNHQQVVYETK